jgi:hypothetical protein
MLRGLAEVGVRMTMHSWKKPQVNEALVVLYLRLNGYFTTGLVVHAPEWGNTRTEIDCLAVRHVNHQQPNRKVGTSPFLEIIDDRVDLLICEVKSVPQEVAFNDKLRSDPTVLEHVLEWAGVFANKEISHVRDELLPILGQGLDAKCAHIGVQTGGARVRGLLCCLCPPDLDAHLPKGWCLNRSEIFQYANQCFNPAEKRDTCSTRYNFELWGSWLAPLVVYFKETFKRGETPSLDGLYKHLGAA